MHKYGVGLIILLSGLLSQEPVVLEGGIAEALPEFEELWTLPVEGEVMDIEIPKAKYINNFYFVTEDDEFFRLGKSSFYGKLIWLKEIKKVKPYYYVYGLKSSDNGNLITLHSVDGWDENVRTWVYDGDGNLLYYDSHGGYNMGFYYPSPSGNFLIYSDPNNFSPLELYDPYESNVDDFHPKIVDIKNKNFLKGKRFKHRFVSNDRLLVYETYEGKGYLYLIAFPDGEVQWTYEFDEPFWLIDFNERNCAYTDQYIALQGTRRPADIYLFDYNGKLIWKIEGLFSNHAISFSSDEKYLISVDKGQWVNIYSVDNRKLANKVWVDKWSLLNRTELDIIGDYLVISQADGYGNLMEKIGERYFAHIIKLNKEKSGKINHYELKGVISTIYNMENSKFKIINSNNTKSVISEWED